MTVPAGSMGDEYVIRYNGIRTELGFMQTLGFPNDNLEQ